MTTLEQLKAVKELIGTPERWTKGAAARNSRGDSTVPLAADACCWCVVGAVSIVDGCDVRAFDAVGTHLPPFALGSIHIYNDLPTTTHSDIMALLDRAIEAEEKKGKA